MTTENKEPDEEQSAEMVAAAEPGARGRTAGLALTGPDGLLKQSARTVPGTALGKEAGEHLGREKHQKSRPVPPPLGLIAKQANATTYPSIPPYPRGGPMEEQHLVSWSQRNATKGEAMPILLIFGFISLIGVVLLLALSLLIGFITAPLRTLALVIEKLCGVVAVVFIIVGVIMYFEHPGTFFKEHDTWMFLLTVIGLAVLAAFCNWFRTRPTRADRRAAQQAEEERQRQTEQRVYDQLAYEQRLRETILAQQMQRQSHAVPASDPQLRGQQPTIIDSTLADED